MSGWMGNYTERSKPAAFRPLDEPARLVTPENGFAPSSTGGHGAPSVTGDRHDQPAREAPAWFAATIEALCAAGGGVEVAARCIGSAGKYRFWSVPAGVRTPAEWEAATRQIQSARVDAKAARRAEESAVAAELASTHIDAMGWVEAEPGLAMADDGAVYRVTGPSCVSRADVVRMTTAGQDRSVTALAARLVKVERIEQ